MVRPFNTLENIKENGGVTLHTNGIDTSVLPFDAWERVIALGKALQTNILLVLDDIANNYHVVDKIHEFKSTMTAIMVKASGLREDLSKAAEAHGITLEALSDELAALFAKVLDELQVEFPAPDEAPSHELRKEMVSRVLDRVEEEIVHIGVKYGVSETNLRAHIDGIKSPIEKLTILTGDLIEEHPVLFDVLVVTASIMLIPEGFILRPLLSLFGFGPYGPVKGRSAAAWCQRRFFGAVVTKGSWFSLLQRAGMRFVTSWWEKLVVGIGAALVAIGVKRA
ncbi:hypothetical protein SERLADRAFT_358925 [Serpula lacrymans var. lacrymans S7.9]|nr:uncharacterized protein SERLADRAFT_358925 [Serpula lacrymans var. lacrymans S7.9]EGO30117.1 hypothetical protein SERLADRAFT_358925 [Serpula lacrymans var. lacrymans S7.9]